MIKTINLEKGGIVLEKFWAGIEKDLRPVLQLGLVLALMEDL